MVGKQALVVGGGNSAGQAALQLSKYAAAVTVLVRSGSLAASMSAYLIREIDSAPKNVAVRFGVEVIGGGGDGRLQHLQLRNRHTGEMETRPPDGRDSCGLAGAPRRRETVGSC
jgi:thioredoxin reductase (NADPH)